MKKEMFVKAMISKSKECIEYILIQIPEIALVVLIPGKYIPRILRYMSFSVHLADPSNLSLIFKTAKKNDRENSYKLSKLLRLKELPEVYYLSGNRMLSDPL
jgi:hypothetical protein